MYNCGLVLEGGGMKGLYTAGVLEYFLENELFFSYVSGVSAGACMGASYVSRQKGRNKEVNVGLASDPRFLSWRNLIFKRELFGMDFLFDEIPNKLVPFDYEAFRESKERFLVATMDCQTGEARYYDKEKHGKDILKIIRASSSLPFIAAPVEYEGRMLLDGGLVDPVPVKKSIEDGNEKNIVVLTKGENKRLEPGRTSGLMRLLYRKYPAVAESFRKRLVTYNETLGFLEKEQKSGNIFIIQPSRELPVSSFERNEARLLSLYDLGYNDAKNNVIRLKQWLS